MWKKVSVILLSFLLCSQPVLAATEEDPWEGFNRSMFEFNDALDSAILKPVAKGYKAVTPNVVQKGVTNFFSNLGEVNNIVNNLLQAKATGTLSSTGRLVINSTIGIFGLFDVASYMGIKEYDEDFGQTLGYWGVGSGPYLVLPFLGPSTLRDGTGVVVDYTAYESGMSYLDLHWDEELGLSTLDLVQTRAHLLSAESFIVGDRYSFIRDVYLQARLNEVHDGNPPEKSTVNDDVSLDDAGSWGDEQEEDSWGDEEFAEDSWGDEEPIEDSWGD